MLEFRNELLRALMQFFSYNEAQYIAISYTDILANEFLEKLDARGIRLEIKEDTENYCEHMIFFPDRQLEEFYIREFIIGYNIKQAASLACSNMERYRRIRYFLPYNLTTPDIVLFCMLHELGHIHDYLQETSLQNYFKEQELSELQEQILPHAAKDIEVRADSFALQEVLKYKERFTPGATKAEFGEVKVI